MMTITDTMIITMINIITILNNNDDDDKMMTMNGHTP